MFRLRTLLPLDDVLGCLRDTIPTLTRSSLHRCLKRHGISRLPEKPRPGLQAGQVRQRGNRLRSHRRLTRSGDGQALGDRGSAGDLSEWMLQ